MSAETWGIVLRDRTTGAEQWVACEVTRDGDIVTARALGYERKGIEYAERLVVGVAGKIERGDCTLIYTRCATPDEYTAHMENLQRILAADEVERLRAEHIARCEVAAFRRGAEAMREAAACEIGRWWQIFASEATTAEVRIRRLPLPVESTPQPAQGHEATATPDAPLTIADAAARARSAAAQRATCDHRWVTTLDDRRVICMRCHETRHRETVLR